MPQSAINVGSGYFTPFVVETVVLIHGK